MAPPRFLPPPQTATPAPQQSEVEPEARMLPKPPAQLPVDDFAAAFDEFALAQPGASSAPDAVQDLAPLDDESEFASASSQLHLENFCLDDASETFIGSSLGDMDADFLCDDDKLFDDPLLSDARPIDEEVFDATDSVVQGNEEDLKLYQGLGFDENSQDSGKSSRPVEWHNCTGSYMYM